MTRKLSASQRGYGVEHRQMRKALEPIVARGGCRCARCDQLIVVVDGEPEPWDLGHTDDRTAWTGPEHARCNREAGARLRHAHHTKRSGVSPSRRW